MEDLQVVAARVGLTDQLQVLVDLLKVAVGILDLLPVDLLEVLVHQVVDLVDLHLQILGALRLQEHTTLARLRQTGLNQEHQICQDRDSRSIALTLALPSKEACFGGYLYVICVQRRLQY